MPGVRPHLQQAGSGVGQAAVGPLPLCRHLMSPTLLLANGCGWLGGAGSPWCKHPCHVVPTHALCTHQHHMATVTGTNAGTPNELWRRMGKQLCLP